MQLSETAAPAGIPNYGLFWFDATCHCPKVISNNGQAVQLGLTNVFNTDANTLEEYNGITPQVLNIYGSRTDVSNYERLRLAYDSTDSYFFVGADAAGTGTQRGLGFWMQGSLRWVIDSAFNLKPWSDNIKDVGTPTLRLKHLYVGTYVDTTTGALATDIPNANATGHNTEQTCKVNGSPFECGHCGDFGYRRRSWRGSGWSGNYRIRSNCKARSGSVFIRWADHSRGLCANQYQRGWRLCRCRCSLSDRRASIGSSTFHERRRWKFRNVDWSRSTTFEFNGGEFGFWSQWCGECRNRRLLGLANYWCRATGIPGIHR